ncbi:MAG TPA: phosphatidate cytidylyltransferase [Limnobacter sp.]|nr:phosphatidate cytidylyltransferase [Limnobacter sp.]
MLKTRVITAVVLLLVLFAVLAYGGDLGWDLFVLLVLLAGFWEWARFHPVLAAWAPAYAIGSAGLACLIFMTLPLTTYGAPLMALSGVFWVAFAPWCLRRVQIGALQQTGLFAGVGWVLMCAAGVALVLAKQGGVIYLLSLVAICWAADIFAYVFGKTFGKHKLAPSISPGKSWEGAVGGTVSVVLLSWFVVFAADHWPLLTQTWQVQAVERWHPLVFTVWLIVLSAFSIVGDLFESMLKRRANIKDSSHLLPGHGGVLDRIDAQLPVLPLAVLLVFIGTV